MIAYGYYKNSDKLDTRLIEELFKSARHILEPEVLHIDNGNPIFIANHPVESRSVLNR